jgi:hypothetical protein
MAVQREGGVLWKDIDVLLEQQADELTAFKKPFHIEIMLAQRCFHCAAGVA